MKGQIADALPGLQAELAGLQMSLPLLKLVAKHNFNPDEPRLPRGQPGGGRWIGGDGSPVPAAARQSQGIRASSHRPSGAITYRAGDGTTFHAPPHAGFREILRYGMKLRGKHLLEQEQSIRAAVAQGGIFDFQRSHGKFVADYTDAANYGVGVLMYGAGYSWASTLIIGNGYAILNSAPQFSMRRVQWWARGYNDAESGRLASRK